MINGVGKLRRFFMLMTIREIIKNDKAAWSDLRTALWPDTSDKHIAEIEDFFAGRSRDVEQVYVVDIEDMVIGFIELNLRNFAEGSSNAIIPYVEGWYIHPDYQAVSYTHLTLPTTSRV